MRAFHEAARLSTLTEKDITGLKYFDQISPLLLRLYADACERDMAGNRTLHYDAAFRMYLYEQILDAIAPHQVADRPDRFEPRQKNEDPNLTTG